MLAARREALSQVDITTKPTRLVLTQGQRIAALTPLLASIPAAQPHCHLLLCSMGISTGVLCSAARLPQFTIPVPAAVMVLRGLRGKEALSHISWLINSHICVEQLNPAVRCQIPAAVLCAATSHQKSVISTGRKHGCQQPLGNYLVQKYRVLTPCRRTEQLLVLGFQRGKGQCKK